MTKRGGTFYGRAVWSRVWRDFIAGLPSWYNYVAEALLGAGIFYGVAVLAGAGTASTAALYAALIGAPAAIVLTTAFRIAWSLATIPRRIYYEDQATIAAQRDRLAKLDDAHLERVRKLLTDHAAIAPSCQQRNTDTVSNWRRRAKELLTIHCIDDVQSLFTDCPDHCLQAELDASRASFEAIAVTLSAQGLRLAQSAAQK